MTDPDQLINDAMLARLNKRKSLAAVSPLNNNDRELGTFLTDRELELFVTASDQEEGGLLSQHSPEKQKEIMDLFYTIKAEKVDPYDLVPIVYDMDQRHPEYTDAVAYDKSIEGMSSQERYLSGNMFGANIQKPYNLERSQLLARYGLEPTSTIDQYLDPKLEIPNNPFSGKGALGFDLALNTRNPTKKQWEYLAKRHGLNGQLSYIKPKDPSFGLMYKDNSSDEWVQVDSPEIEFSDVARGVATELPAIAVDLLATLGIGTKIQPILKNIDKVKFGKPSAPLNRFLESTGVSVLAGGGTAIGEFMRMAAGSASGANNLTFEEVMNESLMMAMFAMAGTAFITTGMQVLPALWTAFKGTRVAPETLRKMEQKAIEANASKSGILPKVDAEATGGTRLTEKDLTEAIEEMVPEMMEHWNPTVGMITGDQIMIDLENAFLRGAGDSGIIDGYQEILKKNQRVIVAYVEEVGKRTKSKLLKEAGDETGETLSIAIREQIEKDVNKTKDSMDQVIESLIVRMGAPEEGVEIAGRTLSKEVDAPDLYEGGFQRTRTALADAQIEHMKPYDKAVQDGLDNTKWSVDANGNSITIGTGKPLTEAANAWKGARKETDKIINNPEDSEAADIFYEVLGTYGNVTLNRLLGRETVTKNIKVVDEFGNPKINPKTKKPLMKEQKAGGKFEYSDFSMKELENTRTTLNSIASDLIGKNATAFRYARALERGIEKQQHQLIRKAALQELKLQNPNKRIGPKAVDKYVYHPRDNPDGTFGAELYETWAIRNKEYNRVFSQQIKELTKKHPSKVIDYLLSGSSKGANVNEDVAEIMYLLKSQSTDGGGLTGTILEIQKGMAARIRNVLESADAPFSSPQSIATSYSKFINQHKGTLKEIFGDGFDAKFSTADDFKRTVVRPLQIHEESIAAIQNRFGTVGEPKPSTTNIISGILNSSAKDIDAGIPLAKMKKLLPYINRDPILKEQIAAEINNVISNRILKRTTGRTGRVPDAAEAAKLFDTFPATGANTFDEVIGPLLGKDSKKHISNLNVIDEMLQRNVTVPPTPSSKAALQKLSDIGISYVKKYFIKPLTQFGRRVNAAERLASERAKRHMAALMTDPKMLQDFIDFSRGKANKRMFTKALIAWGIVSGNTRIANEIGNDLNNYDPNETERTDTDIKPEVQQEDSGVLQRLYDNLEENSPYLQDSGAFNLGIL